MAREMTAMETTATQTTQSGGYDQQTEIDRSALPTVTLVRLDCKLSGWPFGMMGGNLVHRDGQNMIESEVKHIIRCDTADGRVIYGISCSDEYLQIHIGGMDPHIFHIDSERTYENQHRWLGITREETARIIDALNAYATR
jgi:hypothetical protein